MKLRIATAAVVAASAAIVLAGCASSNPLGNSSGGSSSGGNASSGTIVVGSLNFPESETLAAIYAQALQGAGINVQEKLNIGAREITMPALQDGSINLIPEYSGSVLTYLDPKSTASSPDDVMAALNKTLPSGLEALQPAAAQDSDVLAVTQGTADKYHLTSISSLASVAGKFTMGGNPEFQARQAGVAGLKSVYGLTFGGFKDLDEAGPLTISALADGQVQIADMFSTDPSMDEKHFVALDDNKHLFAAQNIVPIIAKSSLTPVVEKTLDAISAKLTTADLISLNEEVVNGQSFQQVATNWLKSKGLK